jgi:cytidylate kinase
MTVVAIDGPAGAGKSTVARRVAAALGFRYVDTGAMYRAVALAALERGIDPSEGAALGRLARALTIVATDQGVTLDGRDVSARIREPDVTAVVSSVSAHTGVRAAMVEQQRRLAASFDVVMEGRDIGSAVVPDAGLKVYLTASLSERARRRWLELGSGGDLGDLEAGIAARDEADRTRPTSPLVRAPDAVEVDTTGKTIEGVVEAIVGLARAAGSA